MGRAKTPGVSVEPDLEDGYAALGYAMEITKEIDTDWYFDSVSELTYAAMSADFDAVVAAAVRTNPSGFRHVYEPGHIGQAEYKLWEMKFYGQGRSREASFEWKLSTIPILTAEERSFDRTDAMSKVLDDDILERLSETDYVFRMQAPVMEYNLPVTTTKKRAKALFIPTWTVQRGKKNKKGERSHASRYFRFEKTNIPDFSYRNPQDQSGSRSGGTEGKFTGLWVTYWNGGGAESVWNDHVAPRIEKGISTGMGKDIDKIASGGRMKKSRKTGMTLTTFNNNTAAMESGRNMAKAFMKGKARSYKQATKYIEKSGDFGGDRSIW